MLETTSSLPSVIAINLSKLDFKLASTPEINLTPCSYKSIQTGF